MNESSHIVCPHCGAVNRIPAARIDDRPACGKCRDKLFVGRPLELTAEAFERHLARNDIPLLVDFWAPWCGPCQMMAPAYEEAAGQLEPRIRVAKLDTEKAQAVGARLGIRSIPTLGLFRGGREVARQAGAMGTADIVRWVQAQL